MCSILLRERPYNDANYRRASFLCNTPSTLEYLEEQATMGGKEGSKDE